MPSSQKVSISAEWWIRSILFTMCTNISIEIVNMNEINKTLETFLPFVRTAKKKPNEYNHFRFDRIRKRLVSFAQQRPCVNWICCWHYHFPLIEKISNGLRCTKHAHLLHVKIITVVTVERAREREKLGFGKRHKLELPSCSFAIYAVKSEMQHKIQ